MWRRWSVRLGIAVLGFLLLVALVDVAIDPLLRGYMERQANARLTGYTVRLGGADFRPFNLSLVLEDAVLRQDAHPEPPVARFPHFEFNVQWTAIFRGRLVADVDVRGPALHVDARQLSQERRDDVDVEDRGWQRAVESLYPLKINEWKVSGGAITYIGDDAERPLAVRELRFLARDLRNVRSRPGDYPSPVRGSLVLFDRGNVSFDGHADFLSEPHAGVKVRMRLDDVPLERLAPVAEDVHLRVSGGRLAAHGVLEYAPHITMANLDELVLSGLRLDYVSRPATEGEAKQQRREAGDAAEESANKPGLLLRVGRLRIADSEFGFVNRGTDPPYRVFVSNTDLTVDNFSNHFRQGPARFALAGRFMGSGRATARGVFRPDAKGPDFDLDVQLEGTQLTTMNNVFRAYAGLDVAGGVFSFYSELRANDGRIDGYVKPLFKDVNVYEPEQDREKGFFRKVYEGIAEGLGQLFENEERDEIATVTRVRGEIGRTETSNWQAVLGLVRNAFFESILPGFEREAGSGDRRERRG